MTALTIVSTPFGQIARYKRFMAMHRHPRLLALLPLLLACSHPVLVLGTDEAQGGGTGGLPTGGAGGGPEQAPISALSIAPAFWDFSTTVLGGNVLKIFTIRNTGNAPVGMPLLSLKDEGVGFAIQKPCATTLLPGQSCDIQVAFSLGVPGKVATELEVRAPSGDRATATLEGRRAGMVWSVPSYDFAAGSPGGRPAAQTFVLTGKALTRITGPVVLSTEGLGLEMVRDGCSGQTLADGSSCSITVRPTAASRGVTVGYLIATAERGGSARLQIGY